MFLDTSGLLCLLHRRESAHAEACNAYGRAVVRLTHSFVLAEFVALANARRIPSSAVIPFLRDLLASPDIETVWAGERLTSRAIALLVSRENRGYSLCDAVSFVLMRERGIDVALTSDEHFEQEGFQKLLP